MQFASGKSGRAASGSPSATPADLSWLLRCSALVTLSSSPSSSQSKFHLSNFAKLSIALNTFIVQASFVSFVSFAVLGISKSGDRLLVMLLAIEAVIQFEVAHIADLCKCVWES